MRVGGGAHKGSDFERLVCATLSTWASDGQRSDLFSRNIMSGGRFTIRVKQDNSEHGMPGDIRANHPLAYEFLSHFLVECKHYKDLQLVPFLFDHRATSFLAQIVTKCRKEAEHAGLNSMVVARQNGRPIFLLLDEGPALAALGMKTRMAPLQYHLFRAGGAHPVYMFTLKDFMQTVAPRRWIAALPPKGK